MRNRFRLVQSVRESSLEWFGSFLLSPMNFNSPVLSPSCFTPIVQHFAGGLDDILAYGGVASNL